MAAWTVRGNLKGPPGEDGSDASVTFGSTAGTAAEGNDPRLSDARPPQLHKSTHATGGPDALVPADIGAQPVDADLTAIAGLDSSTAGAIASDGSGWVKKTYSQLKTALGLVKADVGLGNVDNTSDANKPVSTAQQNALDGKQPLDTDLTTIAGLTATTSNVIQSVGSSWASRTPAQLKATLSLAKSDVGLGNVDNTADTAKPVSTAQQTALDLKQDISAKGSASGYASLDGSTKVPIAQLPTGATSTTVALGNDTRFTDNRVPSGWVDAARAGAVGNGTADDTSALQTAINSLPASGGVLHLAPNSNYKITSALTVKSFLTIDGNGSSITQATTSANAFSGTDITGLALRDLTVIGPGSGTGIGVQLLRSVNAATPKLMFERVVVRSFGGDGIELSNPITSTFVNVESRSNLGHGFNIHGVNAGAAGTSCSFIACYGNGNTKAGFRIDTMVYCSFSGCAADSNGRQYEIVNCQAINFSGCGCESSSANTSPYVGDSWVISGGFGVTLNSCWTYAARTTSVYVTGSAKAVVISGFTENSPLAGATNCVLTDAGTTVTLVHISNTKPLSLAAGTTFIVNDGGGLSIPGYVYGTGMAFFEGEIGSSVTTPTYDGAVTTRGWVNTQLAARVPILGPLVSKTATYTLTDNDGVVVFNTTSAAMTANLPTAVGRAGRRFLIKKLAGSVANTLTIDANGTETIDGQLTEIISMSGGFREIVSDGANWHIVGGRVEPVVATLSNVANGGTINADSSMATVYRVTTTGATATLAVPTQGIDADQINYEITANAALTLTLNASLLLTSGITSPISVPINKRLFLGLRNRSGTGWFVLAAQIQS